MSFRLKVLLIVSFGCLVCTSAAIFISSNLSNKSGKEALVEKSRAILTRLESARNYVANQNLLNDMIANAKKKYPKGNLPKSEKMKVLKTVPIYASLIVGSENSRRDNYTFRVAARNPRKKDNLATPEEVAILEEFESSNVKEIIREDLENQVIHVMRPIHISKTQGCLNCHGHPDTSPWGNGKDVLGIEMENWSDGQLHGMFKITSDLKPVFAKAKSDSWSMLQTCAFITLAVLVLVFVMMLKPIKILNSITEQLTKAAKESHTTSKKLRDSSHSVSEASSEQSAAVQETVASMTEMNSMVTKTSDLVGKTDETSKELGDLAKDGSKIMEGMSGSMESIHSANEELNSMVDIINDISKKTNIINEIVFKTQLLSVNASIEAARAGQHGKGFAVVAEEVGNLAQMSGRAAEEIRTMLENSQQQVSQIVKDTQVKVNEGKEVTQSAINNFSQIADGIISIQNITTQVSEATEQQLTGLQQISEAMSQMDQASQRNNSMANDVSHLGSELLERSKNLSVLKDNMQKLVLGKVHLHHEEDITSKVNNVMPFKKDSSKERDLENFSNDISDDDDFKQVM